MQNGLIKGDFASQVGVGPLRSAQSKRKTKRTFYQLVQRNTANKST